MTVLQEKAGDISIHLTTINNLVAVLAGESAIAEDDRLISEDNISEINVVIGHALEAIDAIILQSIEV